MRSTRTMLVFLGLAVEACAALTTRLRPTALSPVQHVLEQSTSAHDVAFHGHLGHGVLGTAGHQRIQCDSLRPAKLYELRKHHLCELALDAAPPALHKLTQSQITQMPGTLTTEASSASR